MTIDLRTGIDRAPNPLDYCTKSTAISPAPPGTPCPMWMAFLNRVLNNNTATIKFLQRYIGYCCTGYVHEHVLVFLFGTGANGKTTFMETVAGIFNDYAISAPMEMFIATKYERHPTEIARLKGVRLVIAEETIKGRAWDIAKIKNLSGGGTLTGRFMRGDFFDFKPTHKLLLAGNTKPSLRHIDEAIRRRFILVPFTIMIPPAERDPKLVEKLKAEWPAILRWMVDGCLEWKMLGLQIPESIREATDDYLADQDTFGQWIADCTERDVNAFTPTRKLFESWKAWCDARNLACGTETAFADSLKEAGYDQKRTERARGFKGLRLKADPGPDQQKMPLGNEADGYDAPPFSSVLGGENDGLDPSSRQGMTRSRARAQYTSERGRPVIPVSLGRSDDLPYTGSVVPVPSQPPDLLDEHGVEVAPGLSERHIRDLARQYIDRAEVQRQREGNMSVDVNSRELDVWLRAILREEVDLPEHVEIEFERVIKVVFAV